MKTKNVCCILFMLLMMSFAILGFAQDEVFNSIEKARKIGFQKEKGENVGLIIKPGTGSAYVQFRVQYNALLLVTVDTPLNEADITVLDKGSAVLANLQTNGKGNQLEYNFLQPKSDYFIRVTPTTSRLTVTRMKIQALPKEKYPNGYLAQGQQNVVSSTSATPAATSVATPAAEPKAEKEESSNTLFIVFGIVALILVVGIGIFIKKKK